MGDTGESLDRFVFFEVAEPIGIASDLRSLTGWISIGADGGFVGTRLLASVGQ